MRQSRREQAQGGMLRPRPLLLGRPIAWRGPFPGARGVPNREKQNIGEELNRYLAPKSSGGIRPGACDPGLGAHSRLFTSRSGVFPVLLFICSKGEGGLKPTSRAPFPRLFSFALLDSPCCWCGSEDDERDEPLSASPGTSDGAQPEPDRSRAFAVQKSSASPTPRPEPRKEPRKESGTEPKPAHPHPRRTRTEADDSFPLRIIKPARPRKPMRDGRQCSGTGSEDFQGYVIVKWKVLLSPRSRKKTSRCPRKQVSRAEPSRAESGADSSEF